MSQLRVMKDFSECVPYDDDAVPFYIGIGHLSYYPSMKALGHWHDDIEIMKALHGHFSYKVNGRNFLVAEADGIVVNSRQMHYPYSADGSDCEYLCVLFHPNALTANKSIYHRYIEPIITHPLITEKYLHRCDKLHAALLKIIDHFREFQPIKEHELEFLGTACLFWAKWQETLRSELATHPLAQHQEVEVCRKMTAFVGQNYKTALSLADIAASGGVCRSKCCKIFKKYLGKSPIEYLNAYRLQTGMMLLLDDNISITEIAYACGFNSPSYFTEMFLRHKGCTPRNYRKEHKRNGL